MIRGVIYLAPKHSIISVVRVALLLFTKAKDAAFLKSAEPATLPRTIGFCELGPVKYQKAQLFRKIERLP